MIETTTLFTYFASSIVIILAPGPAQALVIAQTISGGRSAGVITAIGLNTATFVQAVGAALGLSAIFATSTLAFAIVKYVGAAYLVYLGICSFKTQQNINGIQVLATGVPIKYFSKAFITGILNPKVALFFFAFVPQFVDTQRGWIIGQFILLGGILAILDAIYESGLAVIVASARNWIGENKIINLWRQRVTGTVLIGLGFRLFFIDHF
jgi:threonine/homoserine/homoserine lactone efflux protein